MPDWDGAAYRQISDLQQWVARESLCGVSICGNEQVLDVGCGDGRITASIADQLGPLGSILGIDPSPRMIEVAEALVGPSRPCLQFAVDDVLTMSYEDAFDLVVSFNALHWVPDQVGALTRIRTALHDSGSALLQFVCRSDRPSLEAVAMEVCALPRWSDAFAGFEPPFVHVDQAAFTSLAEAAGLQVRELTTTDLHWDFASREEFEEWCRVGFDAWTTGLVNPSEHAAYVTEVMDRYSSITGSSCRLDFSQMRVEVAPIDRPDTTRAAHIRSVIR